MMRQEDAPMAIEYRRRESDAILLHVQQVDANVKALDDKMTYHHAIFREEVQKSVESVFERSFPDGDPEGHRRHHELVIQREEERVKFWLTMRVELAKYGLVGFVGWAVYALWNAFLQGPHK